ncbi:hypothetical protein XENTR_v10007310 [Xenopus tropicalis]|uniref:Olfactory receptor n=1 Tax=Xenopus tropicalis TaxID=8364 RepID=A0A1B8Y8U9_XENTR|nr:olfactory receptor 958 [Xenopus tropicalis]KAE8628094.1 hypothetical protein XENTR_v10007310 [Xenopus tropicalis]|eukprot:XP_017944963.1 PREDICTED: olfactory receptor 958-like [Xenopus tropicalis]
MANQSEVLEFVLIGFPGLPKNFHILVSLMMFLIYITALVANGTVIGLIVMKEHLHQPMYIVIGNLSLSDLLFDTLTAPKIIAKYWFGDGNISFPGCFFQLFFVHCLGSVDSFILMLMAADRSVAIFQPLRYFAIVTKKLAVALCCFFWALSAAVVSVITYMTLTLPFCGPNKIIGCFCSSSVVFPLACTDVTFVRKVTLILALSVHLVPLTLIILSYLLIVLTIHSMLHSDNWQKLFYTCTTHLLVISLYFIPRLFVYLANYVRLLFNADINVLILYLYTFLPHLANPIIYCLRNKEIKIILENLMKVKIGIKV